MATAESPAEVTVPLGQIDHAQAERAEYERQCAQLHGQLEAANAMLADAKIAKTVNFGTKQFPRSGLLLLARAKYDHQPDIHGYAFSHAAFIITPTGIYVNMEAHMLSHVSVFDGSPPDETNIQYLTDFTEHGFNHALLQQAINESIEMAKPKTPRVDLKQVTVKL